MTVRNINDAPVICDARVEADPDCDNGNVYLYLDSTLVLRDTTQEMKDSPVTVSLSVMLLTIR